MNRGLRVEVLSWSSISVRSEVLFSRFKRSSTFITQRRQEGNVNKTVALGCLLSLMGLSSCISKNQPPAVSTISPPPAQAAPEPSAQVTSLEEFEHHLLDFEFAAAPSNEIAAPPRQEFAAAPSTVFASAVSDVVSVAPGSLEQIDEHLLDAPPLIQYNPRGTFTSAPNSAANTPRGF
jgi:hypothetical protein